MKWLIELNLFFWTFSRWLKELKSFCSMTPRVQLFLCSNMSQRIDPFFFKLTELNPLFFFKMSQRIEYFFQKNAQRIEPLFHLNYYFLHDSMNWTFFNLTRRVESFQIWLKNLNLRLSMTQRSEPFWTWLKEVNFFEHYSENGTLFSRRRKELNLFSKYDSKNWNFFLWIWLKELNFFFWYDSKKWNLKKDSKSWTCFFLIWLTELNLLFSLFWFKELNFVSKKETQKIEIFFVDKWLTELNSL